MIVKGESGDRYPWEPLTIAQLLQRAAQEHGDREAIVAPGVRMTWAETEAASRRVAKAMMAAGLQRGDHVALWCPNTVEWVLTWFAAAHVGAVIVTVNTRYKTEEVRYIVHQSDARLLVMVGEFVGIDYLGMLDRLCPDLAGEGPPNAEGFPELERVVVHGDRVPDGTQGWDAFVAAGEAIGDAELDARRDEGAYDEPTIIVYTSGTTGHPKGAVHSHVILRNECSISETMDLDVDCRIMNHMPFFHVAGGFTGILPPLITGGAMLLMDRWDPTAALELIQAERATVMSGIPTHFIDLINHPRLGDFDLSTLRSGWIGGASNPREVIDAVITKLGIANLLPVYGMTETTSVTTSPRPGDPREIIYRGVGLPVSDFEVTLVSPDSGQQLGPGVEGEVCVRGHLLMQGYYKNPEATAKVIDADGWFHTGDLGVFDEQGYLAITGRMSDMFIVGGSNAYPAEIEAALAEHPAVRQAYVVGIPDERLGEVGLAFIEAREGAEVDSAALRAFCKDRLANYKIPATFVFVDEWPMTATGKIQRFVLREQALEVAGAPQAGA
ncbi:AMP-binding protein [Baekduia soli]|uniref:AMP-binding protein n=1 Tax=Baekduia soli TaxID=496014 RepID=A0A5B8U2H9_9ACTN|nr:AMP-binding protein [Baekduia soli]QEC47237.1 AMP-binding protein [Baekduia soli]